MTEVEKLKQTLKQNQGLSGDNVVSKAADRAISATQSAVQTKAGSLINEVNGGVQSLTSKVDKFQNVLNNTTTEGLLNSGAASIENLATDMVNDQISKITGAFGSKVEISFTEIDGITVPDESSLDPSGGVSGTIAGVLQLITGLGKGLDVGTTLGDTIKETAKNAAMDAVNDFKGNLVKSVMDASPSGLLSAGQLLQGNIGAFSANTINSLATDVISSVTDNLQATVDRSASANINQSLTAVRAYDSNGDIDSSGSLTQTFTGNMPTIANEFDAMIDNIKTSPLNSLSQIVTGDRAVKQNLTGRRARKDFEDLSGSGKSGATIIAETQNQENIRNQYAALAEERNSLVQSRAAGNGQVGILQSLSADSLSEVKNLVKKYAPSLSDDQVNEVIQLSQGDSQEFSKAVNILFEATGNSAESIRAFLKTIDTTITRLTAPNIELTVFDEPYVIGSFEKTWRQGAGDPVFPYISSIEELQAELRNVTREITEVVVHWTETPTNKNIGSEEINAIHLDNELNGIGYHYVIRRDGSLQRGRPVNIQGEHAVFNNHNDRSIGIVFVGGINAPSETQNLEDFLSVRSLTRSQFNTFDHFCRAFFNTYSGGQIVGHSDIDALARDPGFDVRGYVEANFGKTSKFTNPLSQSPFTQSEINS